MSGWPERIYAVRGPEGDFWANLDAYDAVEDDGGEQRPYVPLEELQSLEEERDKAEMDAAGAEQDCSEAARLLLERTDELTAANRKLETARETLVWIQGNAGGGPLASALALRSIRDKAFHALAAIGEMDR